MSVVQHVKEINDMSVAELLDRALPPHLEAAVRKLQEQAQEGPDKTISAFGSSVR